MITAACRRRLSPRIGIEPGGHAGAVTLILGLWCWLNPIGETVMAIWCAPGGIAPGAGYRAGIPIRDDLVVVHREPGHRLVGAEMARDLDTVRVGPFFRPALFDFAGLKTVICIGRLAASS